MYNLIDDLTNQFKVFSRINKYSYEVYVNDGMTESELYKVTNSNLLYIIDNGSPRNNILPSNINRRLNEWFSSQIEPLMENELFDNIIEDDYDEKYIMLCFEKYMPRILNWYREEIRKIKILDIDMNKFSKQIYCKIIYKDI